MLIYNIASSGVRSLVDVIDFKNKTEWQLDANIAAPKIFEADHGCLPDSVKSIVQGLQSNSIAEIYQSTGQSDFAEGFSWLNGGQEIDFKESEKISDGLISFLQPARESFSENSVNLHKSSPVNDLSALYTPQPGSFAENEEILDALVKHSQEAGTALSRNQIQAYVALGEQAVRAIEKSADAQVVVTTVNPPVRLTPNQEVVRAICWYVAACAARQDNASQAVPKIDGQNMSDLTLDAVYVINDPDGAIYKFLQSSPLVYLCLSEGFSERLARDGVGSQPAQRGIEDCALRLPGQGAALVFDQQHNASGFPQMRLKFDRWAAPQAFINTGLVQDTGQGRASIWRIFMRMCSDAIRYVKSFFVDVNKTLRAQRIDQGILQNTVYKPFIQLVQNADSLGISTDVALDQHRVQAQKKGLPYLETILAKLGSKARVTVASSDSVKDLKKNIQKMQRYVVNVQQQLGAHSDHLGIDRQGAEVHVDLNCDFLQLSMAHAKLTAPRGKIITDILGANESFIAEASRIQVDVEGFYQEYFSVIHAPVFLDLNRNGILIGGELFEGSGTDKEFLDKYCSIMEVAPSSTPKDMTAALLQVCDNNFVAASAVAEFIGQGEAVPIICYLREEFLSLVGKKLDLPKVVQFFEIKALDNGGVELTQNFIFENDRGPAIPAADARTGDLVQLNSEAKLHASVTLRFDGVAAYTGDRPLQPVICKPLAYTMSDFNLGS